MNINEAIDLNTVANKIFQILKGNGHTVKMFTDTGEPAYDPMSDARKFYSTETGLMISLEHLGESSEIKIFLSSNTDFEEDKLLLDSLRQLAGDYGLLYNVRKFNDKLKPKDFAYQAYAKQQQRDKDDQMESCTAKTMLESYQTWMDGLIKEHINGK